jgi:hypothetical protein
MILLGLAACSPSAPDPATAAPVDPLPGLYTIALSGAGLAGLATRPSKDEEDAVCVRASDSPGFADRLVSNSFTLHPVCRDEREPRAGNTIRGIITCPLDSRMAAGTSTVTYEGIVSADLVEATGKLSIDARPAPGQLNPEEQRQLALGRRWCGMSDCGFPRSEPATVSSVQAIEVHNWRSAKDRHLALAAVVSPSGQRVGRL